MSHYWTADDPIESRREQLRDWVEDLIEFGSATTAEACREWRRTETRRPLPADLRRWCIELNRQDRERIALTAANRDMDAYAQSVGWKDNAERIEAMAKPQKKSLRKEDLRREALDITDKWAQNRGYRDFDEYKWAIAEREGITDENIAHGYARYDFVKSVGASNPLPRESQPTGYGVEKVRKERTYTADELRRARIALGIEPAADPDEAAA